MHRSLWCGGIKFRIELLIWLLELDVVYALLTKATDIGASGSSDSVVELKDKYMQIVYV